MNKITQMCLWGWLWACSMLVWAADRFSPIAATQVNWMFAGEVLSETAEHYRYVFQFQRDETRFHITAALFDAETQAVLLHEEAETTLSTNETTEHWQVGHAFLRFNPINASWVLGLNQDEHHGFNFKIDMLQPVPTKPLTQLLRKGTAFTLMQTGPLDGHIVLPAKDHSQFVSSQKTWFRQTWSDHLSDNSQPLKGILCQFQDGSGLYAMHVHETDALRGAVAGLFNAQGTAMNVSQFISTAHEADGQWHIHVTAPAMHLALTHGFQDATLISGFINDPKQPGFCLLNEAMLQHTPLPQTKTVAQHTPFLAPFSHLWERNSV